MGRTETISDSQPTAMSTEANTSVGQCAPVSILAIMHATTVAPPSTQPMGRAHLGSNL